MRKRLLCIAMLFISAITAMAKIQNGYQREYLSNVESLRSLRSILETEENLRLYQRRDIKDKIKTLEDHLAYYELTERTLAQFKIISPGIFNELDNIVDKQGRATEVYVKLIPREASRLPLLGAGFFKQDSIDTDANVSPYGSLSVSIDVWICDMTLVLLAHELGHAKYVIPNLAAYTLFYKRFYNSDRINWTYVGHSAADRSGKMADELVGRFVKDRRTYFRDQGSKPQRVTSMLSSIRETMKMKERNEAATSVAATLSF